MITLCCLFLSVFIKFASAQAIPYGMPNKLMNIANNARGIPNSMAMRGLPNGMAIANNQIARTMPITANNVAKGKFVNRQNLANPYYANNNLANYFSNGNIATNPNIANTNMANIVDSNLANSVIPANQVVANDITTTALENLANANLMQNVATPAIVNIPKGATYNFGNTAIPVTVTGTSISNQPFGINIQADNLEVMGMVSVVGRMPIYGAVTLNGNVPSDGKASVNYGCGSPTAV